MEVELSAAELEQIEKIRSELKGFKKDRGQLIPILQWIQNRLAFLPPEAIEMVAEHLDLSPSEVLGVATFYNQFRFFPPGEHPIKVCLGTACHVKGADIILENFERKLAIREGETTPDRRFSIERVACVGCCALAPVTLMGETVHGHMAPSKVEGLITRVNIEKEVKEREKKAHV
ncbi:MAG: NADH-quinone oxidoreductase subunit NuoE [Deltaproteobacteria bacterium]|nr:NADH-quinone oxidoreductase subunit NuoE [Deltaproteobacteria bacterium]MBW1955365.1 NADH-quinone oxidoreductase subunit NuoE [Deltaproteobacteria bacterium]MBW2042918.1 NADH-quinone oxidoreductase subunit NuoE [Deltaproteobacteria bacterium]MBW2132984.1 NADH-quinone oxidoreductase subunit NuoE [Deltaproteobacteria bacterium]